MHGKLTALSLGASATSVTWESRADATTPASKPSGTALTRGCKSACGARRLRLAGSAAPVARVRALRGRAQAAPTKLTTTTATQMATPSVHARSARCEGMTAPRIVDTCAQQRQAPSAKCASLPSRSL